MRDLLHKKRADKPKAEAQHVPPAVAAKLPQRPEAHERPPHAQEAARGTDARSALPGQRHDTIKGALPGSKANADKAPLRPRGVRDVQVRFFETRTAVGAQGQNAPGRALPAGAPSPDLWRAWVERAYAAWRGGAQAAQHPERASELMSTLTGQPCRVHSTREAPDLLWQVLQDASRAQQPLAAIRHGGDDDPEQPKRRRWHWSAITVLGGEGAERTVQVEGADAQTPAEVLAWPAFLSAFDEVVVAS